MIEALFNCAFLNVSGKVFNTGADKDYSLNELSRVIQESGGLYIKPMYLSDRPQEVKVAIADHTQAKNICNIKIKQVFLKE